MAPEQNVVPEIDTYSMIKVGSNCFRYEANGGVYYLKLYPHSQYTPSFVHAMIQTINRFSEKLGDPIINPISTFAGDKETKVLFNDIPFSQTNYPDRPLEPAIAAFMSRVHSISRNLPFSPETPLAIETYRIRPKDLSLSLLENRTAYLKASHIDHTDKEMLMTALSEQGKYIEQCTDSFDSQAVPLCVLHGDILPKNLLHDEKRGSFHLIDWDSVQYAPVYHEVLRFLDLAAGIENQERVDAFCRTYFANAPYDPTLLERVSDIYFRKKVFSMYGYPDISAPADLQIWKNYSQNILTFARNFDKFKSRITNYSY